MKPPYSLLSFGQFSDIALRWSAGGVETFFYRHVAPLAQSFYTDATPTGLKIMGDPFSIQMPPLRG